MSVIDRAAVQLVGATLNLRNGERGQAMVEYALVLALVAVLCVAALTALNGGISNTLNSVTSNL